MHNKQIIFLRMKHNSFTFKARSHRENWNAFVKRLKYVCNLYQIIGILYITVIQSHREMSCNCEHQLMLRYLPHSSNQCKIPLCYLLLSAIDRRQKYYLATTAVKTPMHHNSNTLVLAVEKNFRRIKVVSNFTVIISVVTQSQVHLYQRK